MNDKGQRRVVLIFGDSGHGKSHLADELHEKYGYYVIRLDDVYVEFIRSRYPDFFLNLLPQVIGQHYNTMFIQSPEGVASWSDHVVSVTKDASAQNPLVAVEGYLLAPVLRAVEESVASLASVTTVEVRYREYFVASTTEQIANH